MATIMSHPMNTGRPLEEDTYCVAAKPADPLGCRATPFLQAPHAGWQRDGFAWATWGVRV